MPACLSFTTPLCRSTSRSSTRARWPPWRSSGELDLATAPRLSAVLGERGDAEVLVADLTATTFIDSTGVRVLVEADRRCAGSATRFVVLVDDGPVLRVLELCELDRWMSVVSGSPARPA